MLTVLKTYIFLKTTNYIYQKITYGFGGLGGIVGLIGGIIVEFKGSMIESLNRKELSLTI